MKDFIVKLLAIYALVVLMAEIVPLLVTGGSFQLPPWVLLQLFVTTIVVRSSVVAFQTFNFKIKSPLLAYVLSYAIVILQAYIFAWIWGWGWHEVSRAVELLVIFSIASTVFILVWILELIRFNQSIESINRRLVQRREKKREKEAAQLESEPDKNI